MRLSKPSPSIVISIVALVFAMTGTGIAAKSALIDGKKIKAGSITAKQIKNGAITAKKLAPYSITPKGVALRAVKAPTTARKAAHTAQTGLDTNKDVSTSDAAALLLEPVDDPDIEAMKKSLAQNGIDLSDSVVKLTSIGSEVNQVKAGGIGLLSNRVKIPAGAVTSNYYAPTTGAFTGTTDFKDAMTATPLVSTTFRNATAQIIPVPGSKLPSLITVLLIARDGQTNKDVGTGCSFDPRVKNYCVLPGTLSVPALSFIAWQVQTLKPDVSAPDFGQYDSYELSLAATPSLQ